MRLRSTSLYLALAILLAPWLHASDNSQQLRDRLKAAADLSALEGHNLHPWHWKLDISVFDKDGKNPAPGSLEMWFSDGKMLSVASLGADRVTYLRIGDTLYGTDGNTKALAV